MKYGILVLAIVCAVVSFLSFLCAESAIFRCQLGFSSMRDRWRSVSSAFVVRSGCGRLSDNLADDNACGGIVA
jgi:hypothetical protein